MSEQVKTSALLLKMEMLAGSLSKSEKTVIDFIIQQPKFVISASVADLAAACGASEATVVRTCKRIGCKGYQDLKVSLAQDIVTPLQAINEEIKEGDDIDTIVGKVFQGAMHTLHFTHDTTDCSTLEKAADAIYAANFTAIIGLGSSNSVALDFQHKLMRLGIRAAAYTDSHLQTIMACDLKPGDVLFCISHSGSSLDIVECAKLAKSFGAVTISMTNIGQSPLSKATDIQLHTASQETNYRIVSMNSRIAQMVLMDSLYTIMASKHPEVVNNFHAIENALNSKKF